MAIDTKELMKQVSTIQVLTRRLVDDRLAGEYHSVFKGQGMEFDEVREYAPGDDVRSIDWNVTARMGHPFIKRFCEERELTLMFLVDVSGSHSFGSGERSKSEVSAEIAALLALSAIRNQDKVGLILFSDKIEKFIPPRKGRTAVMRLVREVLAAEDTGCGTDIAGALRFLNNVQKRKSIVFLVSDFIDSGYEQVLRVTSGKHDVLACPISDPREFELVNAGLVDIEDAETGEHILLDTASKSVRANYRTEAEKRHKERTELFTRMGIDTIPVSTDRPFIDEVRKLFRIRQKRSRGR